MTGNAATWFVDRHTQEGRGEKLAFQEAAGLERGLSYGDLASQSGQFAGALNRAGVAPGERAAMLVLDQIEFPVIFWGALKAGVIPIPINTLLSTDLYTSILQDSGAQIAFISEELLPTVLPATQDCPDLKSIIVIGNAPDGTTSFADFMNGAPVLETLDRQGDDIAFWLYSSGSTGKPKGVRHRHSALQTTCETYGSQVLEIAPDDIVFSAAKLFFAYGLGNGMSFPMSVGATAVLFNGRPTPDAVTDILANASPTIYCGVPTLYAALLQKWESDGSHPSAPLKTCISAGEALPAEIGARWKDLWGVDILDGVGSTEMLHIFLSNRADDVDYGTSGHAVPGYDLKVVDEEGKEVAAGSGGLGELLVRGQSAAQDYWNQPAKSEATFEDGWTRTGDKYEIRDDGRLIYCGRTDDMFKVSGIWVSPFEVEQALVSHPAVLEAAVVAHKDADGLEKPRAFVVLKDSDTSGAATALQEHVKDKVGKWKYPRWIDVVSDLPKTATGKIQRFKLREEA